MDQSTAYSEKELLHRLAGGDEHAFQAIFETHRAKLFNYLLTIVKSREVAEEIVADVFLKIWFGRELATEIVNIDAFLFRVGYHKALNFLRLASRRRELQRLVEYEIEKTVSNPAEDKMTREEYRRLLNLAIEQLTPQRKLVYQMSRVEGLTHDEIAKRLDLSPNTIKNHVTEASKFIREFLRSTYPDILSLLVAIILEKN